MDTAIVRRLLTEQLKSSVITVQHLLLAYLGTWQASQMVGRELSGFFLTVASSQAPAELPSTSTGPASPIPLAALLAVAALVVIGGLRVRCQLKAQLSHLCPTLYDP